MCINLQHAIPLCQIMTKIVELVAPAEEQKMEEMRRFCDWQRHSSGASLRTLLDDSVDTLWATGIRQCICKTGGCAGRRRCVARATSRAMEGAELVDWIIMQFASSSPAHLSAAVHAAAFEFGSGPVTFPMPKRMRHRLRDLNRFKRLRVAPCHIFIWASHVFRYMDLSYDAFW